MIVMAKKSNLFDSVAYQNAGPIMNFLSVSTHIRDRCFVTSEYVQTNGYGSKSNAYN